MRAKSPFDRKTIHDFWPRPSLGSAQNDGRPAWAIPDRAGRSGTSVHLDLPNSRIAFVECGGELLVKAEWLIAFDEIHFVAVCLEEPTYIIVAAAPEDGRSADLVSVQVEDWKHGAVANRVKKARSFPRTLQRRRLGFPIANNRYGDEIRVVERGTEGMHQYVAELPSFMD